MNRMWSVRTKPYRVWTVEPSTMGSRWRCTPSRDTSGPTVPRSPAILSSSSMKITPWFSTRSSASFTTSSMSTSFLSSSSTRMRRSSCRCTVRRFFFLGIISCGHSVKLKSGPSMPCGGCIISSIGKPCCCTSISTSRSSSFPSLSCWRSFSRVRRRRSCASTSPSTAFAVTSPLDETTNSGALSARPSPFSPGERGDGRGGVGVGGRSRSSSRSTAGAPALRKTSAARRLGSCHRGHGSGRPSELQNGDVRVGVHADVGGDFERALHDVLGRELRLLQQRPCRGERVVTARADRQDAVVGLDQLARPRDHVAVLLVRHHEQRFEAAQHTVGAPVLGELHGRARQVAGVALELLFELLEQGERVGGRSRKASEDLAALERPDLVRIRLHHGVAEGHLSVAAEGHVPVAAHRENRRAVNARHLPHARGWAWWYTFFKRSTDV